MPVKIKKFFKNKNKKMKNGNIKYNEKYDKKIIILLLLIFIILLGIFVGISYSKYQSKIETQAYAKIAKPILQIKREQSLLLTALAPKATYVFEVRNYTEDELNEIEMEYYIEIISKTDESIKFELYQGENKIPLTENKTDNIKLTKDEKQTHSYRLEITYEKSKQTLKEDINENVEVKIHSIQKA